MKGNLAVRNQMLYKNEDIGYQNTPHLLVVTFWYLSHSRFPAVLPARAIYTALGLELTVNTHILCSVGKRIHYLLTDPLPAILALDGMLDD